MQSKTRIRQPVLERTQIIEEQNINDNSLCEKVTEKLNELLKAIYIQLPDIEGAITTLIKYYQQFTIQEFDILYKTLLQYDQENLNKILDLCREDKLDYLFLKIIVSKLTQTECKIDEFQEQQIMYHVTVNQPIWSEIYLIEFPQDNDAWLDAVGCQKFESPSTRMIIALKKLSDEHLIEALSYFEGIPFDIDIAYVIWKHFHSEDGLKQLHRLIKADIEYFEYFFSKDLFKSFKKALDDLEFENYYTSIDYILDIIKIILDKQLSKYTVDILNESLLMDSLVELSYMQTCIRQLFHIIQAIQYRSQSKNTRYLYQEWYYKILKILVNQNIDKKSYDFALNCINNNNILRDRFKGRIKKFQKLQKFSDSSKSDCLDSSLD